MTTTPLSLRRDVVLIIPADVFATTEGVTAEGIEVKTPLYRIYTEDTDTEFNGESVHAAAAAAANFLFPGKTADDIVHIEYDEDKLPPARLGHHVTTATISLVTDDSQALRTSLIEYTRTLAEAIPGPKTETLTLTELSTDNIGEIITVHVLDAPEGSQDFSGRLVDFAKDYLNPEWTHITGNITLYFEGRWSATVNLHDQFTYPI